MTRYHKKKDGVLRIGPNGECRYLAWWERVVLCLGGKP